MNIQKVRQAPTAPGIYSGLSNAAYHAGPGVSKSGLDILNRSPLHYWHRYVSPNPPPSVETAAMRFGTAVHAAVLEPEDFDRWVVMPSVDGRTTAGKAAKADATARAEHLGVPLIDADTKAQVLEIAAAVRQHEFAGPILENGVPELSVYWKDEESGVLCRCRPDWLGQNCILDLKTTEDAAPNAFMRSAYSYRYWVQAAFYLDGLAANGVKVNAFYFAAIEKTAPYAVMGYRATNDMIEAGRREYKRLLKILALCHFTNQWPGYGNVLDLDLPRYANERFTISDDAFAADAESV